MTFDEFRRSLVDAVPPAGISPLLRALWFDRHGDWDGAHRVAQDVDSADGSWVHAYLHRREGDLGNARYWYHRAGRREATDALEAEWDRIAAHLLGTTSD